jgi:hypothetical protein
MIPARNIIYEAQRTLNDTAGVRVPASDLVIFLNRAQRDIHTARMDTTASLAEVVLVEGDIQTLPPEVALLIDIPALANGAKSAISKTEQAVLDAVAPNWRGMAPTETIKHYIYDQRDPRTFYVYPPAVEGTTLRAKYSAYPKDIDQPTPPGLAWTTVNGAISLADEWQTALLMLTLAYAYMSDLEGVSNQPMAAMHLQQASALLGVELQAKAVVGPQRGD